MRFQPLNLSGQRFGRLVAIERQEKKWFCRCDCGGTKLADVARLRRGISQSCGCLAKENAARVGKAQSPDLTGQRFGRLVVVERRNNAEGRMAWLCACDCGGAKIVKGFTLRAQRSISCGCAKLDRPGLTPASERARVREKQSRRRAQAAEAGGSFTEAQILALFKKQRGCCANCRGRLPNEYHRDHKTPLARGGSNDITNIELLCCRCNIRKNAKDPIAWAQENGRLL